MFSRLVNNFSRKIYFLLTKSSLTPVHNHVHGGWSARLLNVGYQIIHKNAVRATAQRRKLCFYLGQLLSYLTQGLRRFFFIFYPGGALHAHRFAERGEFTG
jgi:hypothetical protein